MAWLHRGNSIRTMVRLVGLMTILAQGFCEEKKSEIHLEYICAEPDEEKAVPVIMLHGALDIKETWNGIYQNVSALTQRKVCVYDARNHGGSSWTDTLAIDPLVDDLGYFMNMKKIDRAVLVGHSMGGQTAMKFALINPTKVEGIFVEDIGVKFTKDVRNVLQFVGFFLIRLMSKSLSVIPQGADDAAAKKSVVGYLKKVAKVEEIDMADEIYDSASPFQLKNGVWQWKTNLKAAEKALEDMSGYETKFEGQYEGKTVFIYGKKSFFKIGEQQEDIRKIFPNVKFVALEKSSHIVHFNRSDFIKHLLDFLK